MLPYSCNSAHGYFIGTITLDQSPPHVSAGGPVPLPPCPFEPTPATLWRFLLTSDYLSAIGLYSGDEILIDSSPLGYWDDPDYDREIVVMNSNYGPLVGRLLCLHRETLLELLDGSGDSVICTPEMQVLGVARYVAREVGWSDGGGTFL